ncbi:unnamed protein product [Parnassius apollo]|uniref:(apollo) hypothetical protein n=1 Tax=Parnassius apollo TaxID=110799 RepID=A0A8S3WP70_PARAO|nr:unnamed protein product [Parnassius apollo]
MFLKYDIKCPTNITSNDQIGFGDAKWSHIKEFYETDNTSPNFVFAPCLKQEHLNPNTKQKMKVKLDAQVLSHSVAAGMYAKISQGNSLQRPSLLLMLLQIWTSCLIVSTHAHQT